MEGGATSSQPLPVGKPPSSKWPPFAACAKPSSGTDCTVRAVSPISCTKLSMEELVAASALADDSVGAHRSRPSGVMRLDLLKVVGSRPERLASPEADSPPRSASRSSAVQIWSWVSILCAFGCLAIGQPGTNLRNYCLNKPAFANWCKHLDAALEVRRWRRYGRKRTGNSGKIPSYASDKQDTGIRAQG